MAAKTNLSRTGKRSRAAALPGARLPRHATLILEEARRAGLLDGDRTEHLSFRAPKALIEAAKRESGATRPTELGLLALAMLAQPDPTANFLKATRGKLGADHALDY
jgi:hypothetical protein